jgi:hypothetical protein
MRFRELQVGLLAELLLNILSDSAGNLHSLYLTSENASREEEDAAATRYE